MNDHERLDMLLGFRMLCYRVAGFLAPRGHSEQAEDVARIGHEVQPEIEELDRRLRVRA